MKFRVGELTFTASVAESDQRESPQTGAPLRVLTIEFRAPKVEMHEQLLAAIEHCARGGVFSIDEANEAEWRVEASGFTYVGSEPWGMHHHTWRIEQVERLSITSLVLGPLTLVPYDYREELSDGQLRLAARAPVNDAELTTLASLSTVDVVRAGISAEPRRMHVEGYVWGNGAHGQAVALMCVDAGEPRVTLAEVTPVVNVFHVLLDKGILDRAEVHAARRVADIDAWAL
jgi:hypothetical protein